MLMMIQYSILAVPLKQKLYTYKEEDKNVLYIKGTNKVGKLAKFVNQSVGHKGDL